MILLTGATGYIASHTWVELARAGHRVIGVDNFANSKPSVLDGLASIMGDKPEFAELDVRDTPRLTELMQSRHVEAVIHFAAHKAVGESIKQPLAYYANNIGGLLSVCESMQQCGVRRIVFSSSAAIYAPTDALPIPESAPKLPSSPYGTTKLLGETILHDLAKASNWDVAVLRYFNPAGSHPSGLIGEDPQDTPSNLVPYVAKVVAGALPVLPIYGNDYETPDGTGVRDFIHVVDLATAHVAALQALGRGASFVVNVGTGRGYSVLEVVRAYEQVSGRTVSLRIAPRRPGDVAACYADASAARALLGWQSRYSLLDICQHSWRWQQKLST
jgi:UDP-glucose 4-epimerase